MKRFLLQMTGEPGAGKSTLARAIGRETGALVLDKDIVKSRILDGDLEMGLDGLPESVAVPLHHAMMFDLARAVLKRDSAWFWMVQPSIQLSGRAAAP
jgi:predicted kinase